MIYVIGDIHGNMTRFNSIMEQIRLQPTDTLYILGDVIDRHPYGIQILRKLMRMQNVKMILGNHEYMMLNAIGEPGEPKTQNEDALELWYQNGGEVTHSALKRIRIATRKEIFQYLRALPLNIDIAVKGVDYKLVHGAPLSEFARHLWEYDDQKQFAVWKRWNLGDMPKPSYTMIFGHTPTNNYQKDRTLRIYHGEHVIGMDCGSGYNKWVRIQHGLQGRLACLRLDDMQEFYSAEDDEEGADKNTAGETREQSAL